MGVTACPSIVEEIIIKFDDRNAGSFTVCTLVARRVQSLNSKCDYPSSPFSCDLRLTISVEYVIYFAVFRAIDTYYLFILLACSNGGFSDSVCKQV
jgi:hypothetical protein